jgi:hypothetical protein
LAEEGRGKRAKGNCTVRSFMICAPYQIVLVIKSKMNWWARHVAQVGEKRCAFRFLVGRPKRKTLKTYA